MVGRKPLKLIILVRIQIPQPILARDNEQIDLLMSGFETQSHMRVCARRKASMAREGASKNSVRNFILDRIQIPQPILARDNEQIDLLMSGFETQSHNQD